MTLDLSKRDIPQPWIRKTIEELLKRNANNKVIVELGCIRQPFDHPIDAEPDNCPSRCDGHSTAILASTGLEFYSVDVNSNAIELARNVTKNYPNAHIICEDGILFLQKFNKNIDLLFLDAWDVENPQSALKHFEAFNYAKKNLHGGSLVLIDDTDVNYDFKNRQYVQSNGKGGKAQYLIPMAIKQGWHIVFDGRCTLLSK